MIQHIWTILKNNRRANLLLGLGMFVISLALWYSVDYVYTVAKNQCTPLGFDWHHVYHFHVSALPEVSADYKTDRQASELTSEDGAELMRRLNAHPAVESSCITIYHAHYVWKNAQTALLVDSLQLGGYLRLVTPEYFRVFRVKTWNGGSPELLVKAAEQGDNPIIVAKRIGQNILSHNNPDAATDLTAAIGRKVLATNMNEDSMRIAAFCEDQKYNEFTRPQAAVYGMMNPIGEQWLTENGVSNFDFYFRVKEGADTPDFLADFRKEMGPQLRVGNLYVEDIVPVATTRAAHLSANLSELYTYLTVSAFFLVNAFLAILGTFWFRTQERTEEMAVRLVVGSRPRQLMALLMGEGLLLVTLAYIPALIVAYVLGANDLLATYPIEWSFVRFLVSSALTYVLLAAITVFSIGFPARRAMKLNPAVALHGE
jgi:putative ABC transport system permease protein